MVYRRFAMSESEAVGGTRTDRSVVLGAVQPTPRQMKALVKREDRESYVLETVDVEQPSDDEVLIRVDAVAICGSDIALYRWNDLARVWHH